MDENVANTVTESTERETEQKATSTPTPPKGKGAVNGKSETPKVQLSNAEKLIVSNVLTGVSAMFANLKKEIMSTPKEKEKPLDKVFKPKKKKK